VTIKLALLIAALIFALALVAIDFRWIEPDGDTHLPAWLGLSLACFYGHLLVRR